MKTALLTLVGTLMCMSIGSIQAASPGPGQAVEIRLMEVEIEALVDAYGDVFREIQKLRNGAIHLEVETRNEEKIERDVRQVERGIRLMDRRLHELKEGIQGRAERIEAFHREHARQSEERENMERERMNQNRQRQMEQRERMERERFEQRETDTSFRGRPDGGPRPQNREIDRGSGRRQVEKEVEVFVDGREIDIDKKREED